MINLSQFYQNIYLILSFHLLFLNYKLFIFINLLYKLMNFETSEPFDRQLGRLLAMIILCQKKIQQLKKKLSGNQEFHTRLIFQRMDFRKKGQITPQDIVYCLSTDHYIVNLLACQYLCRKYTVSGAINYQELLAMIIPKTDKALAQRMLIRTTKRGASLPNYLWKYFCELFVSIISMSVITQEIRRSIQNCTDLNHLQMVQFFRIILRSPQAIWKFCNENSDEQYDFTIKDTSFLSNNIRSGNPLNQMTDQDIKQLICPIDMNFQKTVHEMAPYYENIKLQKYRTINGTFFNQTKLSQQAKKTASTNFLNTNYRSLYPNFARIKQNLPTNQPPTKNYNNYNYNIHELPQRQSGYVQNIKHVHVKGDDSMLLKPSRVFQGSKMYLDNFIKPLPHDYGTGRSIQLDRFLAHKGHQGGPGKNKYQRFQDQLPENLDSSYSNSAFVQY